MCSLSVQVKDLVDKIVEFKEMLGDREVRLYQILHMKPPTKPGRFAVDMEWFNTRVNLVNRLFDKRLGRYFCQRSHSGAMTVFGHLKIKLMCVVRIMYIYMRPKDTQSITTVL